MLLSALILSIAQPDIIVLYSRKLGLSEFQPKAEIDMASPIFEDESCNRMGNEGVICKNSFATIMGVKPKSSKLEVYQTKLSRLYFSGKHSDFQSVSAAITAKYGKPCTSKSDQLGFPNSRKSLTSLKQTWCFQSGNLVLVERKYFSDNFVFEYRDKLGLRPSKRKN